MMTDVNLQRDVLDELDWDPCVDVSQVGVIAKEGVVTLTGHVTEYAAKHAAEVAAKRVHGVRAVANEIDVRPRDANVVDDEEIAQAALHALKWDSRVPDDHLQVSVEDGWVTVEGAVQRQHQLQAVEWILHHLAGIRGLTNAVTVVAAQAATGANQLQDQIEAALRRSATVNSKRIAVTSEGAHVTLTGDVHSHAELDEAARIAWSARGVVSVRNCLTITPWGHGPAEEWGY